MKMTAKKLTVVCCLLLCSASTLAVPRLLPVNKSKEINKAKFVLRRVENPLHPYKEILRERQVNYSKYGGSFEYNLLYSKAVGSTHTDRGPAKYIHGNLDSCSSKSGAKRKLQGYECQIAPYDFECELTEAGGIGPQEFARLYRKARDTNYNNPANNYNNDEGNWYLFWTNAGGWTGRVSYNCWKYEVVKRVE